MYTTHFRPPAPPRHVLVTELEHVVLIRRGKVEGPLKPGRHRMRRRFDRLWIEPATPQVVVVPSQEILTSDGATVRATVASTVRIVDPIAAMRSGEWRTRFHLEVQQSLRADVTSTTLEDLVANRGGLDESIGAALAEVAAEMGVTVARLSLRDLVVTGEPRRQMAEVVAARLAGQASLERARGETAALRNLANAASLLRDNPELYRLRLLQEIGSSTDNTFVIGTETQTN